MTFWQNGFVFSAALTSLIAIQIIIVVSVDIMFCIAIKLVRAAEKTRMGVTNLNVPTSATFHIIIFIVYFKSLPRRSSQGHMVRLSLFVLLLNFWPYLLITVKFLLGFTKLLPLLLPSGNNFFPDDFPSREGHLLC